MRIRVKVTGGSHRDFEMAAEDLRRFSKPENSPGAGTVIRGAQPGELEADIPQAQCGNVESWFRGKNDISDGQYNITIEHC